MTKVLDDCIHWYLNPAAGKLGLNKPDTSYFSSSIVRRVKDFHHTLPNFKTTLLAKLDNFAGYSGIKSIRVKDESYRCGLNAFKVLGASYALSSYLSQRLKLDPATVSFELLKSGKFKNQINELTCITATDGNHGRAVAWAAHELGCRAVVYMLKGSTGKTHETWHYRFAAIGQVYGFRSAD